MLELLHIKNLALIEDMKLDFTNGMNVLTGETGAGKSFIIKALNFVLGEKLETSLIRPNAEKAEVEALFVRNNEEIIIKRELIAETGRSRFYINGNLATQEKIKQLSPSLILHASQHGQQKLLQSSFQARLIDDYLDDKSKEVLKEKDIIIDKLKELKKFKESLIDKINTLRDKRELLENQNEIIQEVKPIEGEEESLETAQNEFRSAEKSRSLYEQGLNLLHSDQTIASQVNALERILSQLTEFDPTFSDNILELQAFTQGLSAIDLKLRKVPTFKSEDGLSIEEVGKRLFELSQLKRKLKRSIPEILNLQSEINENLSFLDNAELELMQLDKKEQEYVGLLQKYLQHINNARNIAAQRFCSLLKAELQGLGFAEALDIIPNIQNKEIWSKVGNLEASIEDIYTLLFAPNPGQPPQALDKIASGGELSRFLLAITSLQANSELSMLVFDEVDAGIGGNTLIKVADRLNNLANKQQMLLITHWANLAKYAKKHFVVEKEVISGQTYTKCSPLDKEQIVKELDRMQGIV